ALAILGVLLRHEVGAGALVGEGPARAAVVGAQAADSRDANPHSLALGGIGHDGVQTESAVAGLPVLAGGGLRQTGVGVPCDAAIGSDPEAGGVHSSVKDTWLLRPARLDDPDVGQAQSALGGELDAALRLLPGLAEVVAVAQERPKEVAVLGGEEALA